MSEITKDFSTPMMKQYLAIKRQYPDCLLFFRLGDFYELFMDDASIGAQVLDITLTARPEGKDGRVPMCGVPYHAVDSYLSKLVKAGYKVAICEQISEPNKRGIVEREVIRIVTPGTLVDEKALERKENNFLVSLSFDSNCLAVACADLSTGDVQVTHLTYTDLNEAIEDELAKIHPAECILSSEDYNNPELLRTLKTERNLNIYPFLQWEEYSYQADVFLKKHFALKTLGSFGIESLPMAQVACAALIGYLKETQKDHIAHIKKISLSCPNNFVSLDKSTMINLELFSTLRDHDVKGSLLSVIDYTQTAMGGRMLRQWIAKPLTGAEPIMDRFDAIEALLNNRPIGNTLQETLKEIPDIERIISRLSIGVGNARDMVNLKNSLKTTLEARELLPKLKTSLSNQLYHQISTKLLEVISTVESTIVDEPPVSLREGELIKTGINNQLDDLRSKISGSREWIIKLETIERERTGINNLKVRFNKVFGFYIEISKANAQLAPQDYIRKQTLVNGERFITPELKKHEEIVLTAEAAINELEFEIFQGLLEEILKYVEEIQQACRAIAVLDCLVNFAYIAQKKRYVRPKIIYSGEIKIKAGRHPVVEDLLDFRQFVPNDADINQSNQQLLVITGPNMAGKSVFIRQVAIITLMAQIGCFVPAEKAHLSLVDKIFVRSGASDVITSGLSTFMVEMMETAHILNHCTSQSLIVMDEIGRGTSTYDGISIAWAVAEYLVTHKGNNPKTLFATHYHELQALEDKYPEKIKNFHMSVDNSKDDPIFLYTIMPGAASHSFGVAVAKLAGIPKPVIDKALEMLSSLESRHSQKEINTSQKSKKINNTNEEILSEKIKKLDVYNLTPLEALNELARIKKNLN